MRSEDASERRAVLTAFGCCARCLRGAEPPALSIGDAPGMWTGSHPAMGVWYRSGTRSWGFLAASLCGFEEPRASPLTPQHGRSLGFYL